MYKRDSTGDFTDYGTDVSILDQTLYCVHVCPITEPAEFEVEVITLFLKEPVETVIICSSCDSVSIRKGFNLFAYCPEIAVDIYLSETQCGFFTEVSISSCNERRATSLIGAKASQLVSFRSLHVSIGNREGASCWWKGIENPAS